MRISRSWIVDLSRLWSVVATVVATGALTELVPAQYKAVAAALGAVVLALHPSPLSTNSSSLTTSVETPPIS